MEKIFLIYPYDKILTDLNSNLNFEKEITNLDLSESLYYKYPINNVYKNEENIKRDINNEINFFFKILKINFNNNIRKEIEKILIMYKIEKKDVPYIVNYYENNNNNFITINEINDILYYFDNIFLDILNKQYYIKFFSKYINKNNNEELLFIHNYKESSSNLILESIIDYIYFINNNIINNNNNYFLTEINKLLYDKFLFEYNKFYSIEINEINNLIFLSPYKVINNIYYLTNNKDNNKFYTLNLNKDIKSIVKLNGNDKNELIYVLKKCLNLYILQLYINPLFKKYIFDYYFEHTYITTIPTEEGKKLLKNNSLSFRCKRIEKRYLKTFFFIENKNTKENFIIENYYNIINGDLFLDMEECRKKNLIKINFILETNNNDNFNKILLYSLNGIINENEYNKLIECNITKKNIIFKKSIIEDFILKNDSFFFLQFKEYINNKLYQFSLKNLIFKISKKFSSLINRNYLNNVKIYNNINILSIFYDKFSNRIFLSYYYYNGYNLFNIKNKEIKNIEYFTIENIINDFIPNIIIINGDDIFSFKIKKFIKNFYKKYSIKFIFSDYFYLFKNIDKNKIYKDDMDKNYQNNFIQTSFILNPLKEIIKFWNYLNYKNNIYHIKLDRLQKFIDNNNSLYNYVLECEIKKTINKNKINILDINKNNNYIYFINGLGYYQGKKFLNKINNNNNKNNIKNVLNLNEIKNTIFPNQNNIFENIKNFILFDNLKNNYSNNINKEEDFYDINNINDNNSKFNIINNKFYDNQIFYTMINDYKYFKINNYKNALIKRIDNINCNVICNLLIYNNEIECYLPFIDIDDDERKKIINNNNDNFLILCKIKEINVNNNDYNIIITMKENFNNNYNNDDINNELNNIIQYKKLKQNDNKIIYERIISNPDNSNYFFNVNYTIARHILKFQKRDLIFRPSIKGYDFITLTYKYNDIINNIDIPIYNNTKILPNEFNLGKFKNITLNELRSKFIKIIFSLYDDVFKNKNFLHSNNFNEFYKNVYNTINNINTNINKNKIKTYITIVKEYPDIIIYAYESKKYFFTFDIIYIHIDGYKFHNNFFKDLYDIFKFTEKNYKNDNFKDYYNNFNLFPLSYNEIENIELSYQNFNNDIINFNKIEYYYNNNINKEFPYEEIKNINNYHYLNKKRKKRKNSINNFNEKNNNNNDSFLVSSEFSWYGDDNLINDKKDNINNWENVENNNNDWFNKTEKNLIDEKSWFIEDNNINKNNNNKNNTKKIFIIFK